MSTGQEASRSAAALAEADFSASKAAFCCSVGLINSLMRCTGNCVKFSVCCLHKPPRLLEGDSSRAILARRYLVLNLHARDLSADTIHFLWQLRHNTANST